MSAFNASIWAIRFDGTPPQPSVMGLHKDEQWPNIEAVRWWVAEYFSEPFPHAPVHAVFIVGRDCNTIVLDYWQASHAIETQPSELATLRRENDELRSALTDFVRDAEFRACEDSTPGLLLRLAKGRTALANSCTL